MACAHMFESLSNQVLFDFFFFFIKCKKSKFYFSFKGKSLMPCQFKTLLKPRLFLNCLKPSWWPNPTNTMTFYFFNFIRNNIIQLKNLINSSQFINLQVDPFNSRAQGQVMSQALRVNEMMCRHLMQPDSTCLINFSGGLSIPKQFNSCMNSYQFDGRFTKWDRFFSSNFNKKWLLLTLKGVSISINGQMVP